MGKLVDMVKNKQVHFQYAFQSDLWYSTDDGFYFPVPMNDMGNGKFQRDDKAALFIRYIRKQLAKEEQ